MDISERLKILNDFLNTYENVLRNKQEEIFFEMKNMLTEYQNFPRVASVHGNHFSNCVWSKDTTPCGPDTCNCFYFERKWAACLQKIKFYPNLKRKNCNECNEMCNKIKK